MRRYFFGLEAAARSTRPREKHFTNTMKRYRMTLGMSTACFFGRHYTEDAVLKIAEAGARQAEVFLCCASEYGADFAKDVKKRLDASGIRAISVHALSVQFEPQLFSSHQRARADAYAVFERVLEAAAVLGAGLYTFHGAADLRKAAKPPLDFGRIAENASQAADKAAEYGVKLAWENVHWGLYCEPSFVKSLLERDVSRNLLFTLDVKQAALARADPEAFIRLMGKRLANVHICDYVDEPGKGMRTRLPFEGSMDYARFKQALESAGYSGPLIYEVYAGDYGNEQALKDNYRRTKAFFESETPL